MPVITKLSEAFNIVYELVQEYIARIIKSTHALWFSNLERAAGTMEEVMHISIS